ncbi:MAG TPA: hypothetical protein VN969_30620 [Streptosporangiaceae bacterium]|nr:hypothetical protein [Streptosporangiaceae bacterium]
MIRYRPTGGRSSRQREQPFGDDLREAREFRDIPLPEYVNEAIDKHAAEYGTPPDRYLFQGRKYKLVVRRGYQGTSSAPPPGQGCRRTSSRAHRAVSMPPPPSPKASRSPNYLAGPVTKASRSPIRSTVISSPHSSTASAPSSTPPTAKSETAVIPKDGAEPALAFP